MDVKETYRLQPVYAAGGVRIAAVIWQKVHCAAGHPVVCVFGRKLPVAIVLVAGSRCQVTALEGETASLLEDETIRADIDAFVAAGVTG